MPRFVDHDARRAVIDAAVIAIAGESGFASVTIRAVAERIGASTSVVTHYVANRDELLRNAVQSEVEARLAEADDAIGSQTGAAGLRALFEWAMEGPTQASHLFWLAAVLGATNEPVLQAELNRFNHWWATRVQTLLAQSTVDDPDIAADMLNVFIDGLIVNGFYEGSPWMVQRRSRLLDALWRAIGL